jgi:type IX secretion system PorP/SprF family membrane protein
MKKLIIITALIITGFQIRSVAQDIHFSQFNEAPLLLNPALTGSFNGDHRAILNYKDQWGSVAKPYQTYAFSYDAGLFKEKFQTGYIGIGVSVFKDIAGDMKFGTSQANFSVAYHQELNENNELAAGLQGGYTGRSLDPTGEQWDNQYDGTGFNGNLASGETSTFQNFSYGDFSGGIVWNYFSKEMYSTANNALKINLGGCVDHINQPKLSFYQMKDDKLFMKYTIHGGAWIGLKNTNTSIIPSGVFWKQGTSQEITAGSMFRFRLKEESRYTGFVKESAFSIGGFYRVGDAMIACTQFEIGSWAFGVSYDINTSGLKAASNGRGGLEVFMRYISPNPFKTKTNKSFY